MDDDKLKEEAQKRAAAEAGFYKHLVTYLVGCVALTTINYVTSPGSWWVYWPIIGWGIGILWHAAGVFFLTGLFGSSWEQRRVDKIMKSRRNR